ncbi:hypothetical protein P153DRAFT_364401 [Dothidotthia symphoricarpi CBS 119687]|uniref:Rrn9 domain-containing protein n=1 Tax=Dothidotthia symphoricarpi CBS 119687 TaxID=1392245 RepID=A0A6A6ALX1_9PLEO|nr:uncharacterized protein P153DRAFT_364401 [Dothidotthia symphoricarpi CBS 119687]KAF2131934.1 hypothetical protein P153DRAFT_364401 [Dothidotthia symphoricarpi CBS 119687]
MSLFGGDGSIYDSESDYAPPTTQPLLSVAAPTSPPSAQNALGPTVPLESDADDDPWTDSEPEIDQSADEQRTRPNRYIGHPQTWKGHTLVDREIAASLDHMQETDLAAHLYNAHALKRRVRRPARETAALKSWQGKHHWSRKTQTELVPSKDWTAWPLPPARTQHSGDELQEETLATFLRLAKERWSLRCTGDDMPSASRADVKVKDDDVLVTDNAEPQTDDEAKEAKRNHGKKRGRKPQTEPTTEPTVLADDAQAYRILQPTIHSILSSVDELALAVRRTRLNHYGRGAYSDKSSQGDFTSDAEQTEPDSSRSSTPGSRGTPNRKPSVHSASRKNSARTRSVSRSGQESTDDHSDLLDNDSNSDVTQSSPHGRKRSRSGSEDSASAPRDYSGTAGLMDWSEVLGIAALKCWNEQALMRTAQRCAALFGESMSFVPFDESLATKSVTEPVHYTPSSNLASGDLSIAHTAPPKRPLFQVGTLRCPHTDCWGHAQAFAIPYRVIEHCMRVHGYDPRDNDSTNEERTVGGVHIDGFLQPITVKPGWLGHGRSKAGSEKVLDFKQEREQSRTGP